MSYVRLPIVVLVFAVLALPGSMALGQGGDTDKKPGALPRKAQSAKKAGKGEGARMSTAPAPKTGSMPKGGPTPTGKLGTEPKSKGKLGTEPKPGDPQSRPPRPQ